MEILIDNLQEKKDIDLSRLRQVALNILHYLRCQEQCELSIALVDDQEMQRLNRAYRGIDRNTDVLSFAQQENVDPQVIQPHAADTSFPLLLGDVILSVETTQKQAEEHGHAFERELDFLLIHGILHLRGYDHQIDADAQVMERLEQELFSKLECS
jgi:probable rRNA maturation factor